MTRGSEQKYHPQTIFNRFHSLVYSITVMALFVPVIVGLPIGYFTWAKVFDTVDNSVYQITQKKQSSTSLLPSNSGTFQTRIMQ